MQIDPELQQKIRAIYLRLAALYHPDKHPGSNYHVGLMQEINAAYGSGDLVRLLEIERGGTAQPQIDPTQELLDQIDYLERQHKSIFTENMRLANSPELGIDDRIKSGEDPIGQSIANMTFQINLMSRILKTLSDFASRKIGISDFVDRLYSDCTQIPN